MKEEIKPLKVEEIIDDGEGGYEIIWDEETLW